MVLQVILYNSVYKNLKSLESTPGRVLDWCIILDYHSLGPALQITGGSQRSFSKLQLRIWLHLIGEYQHQSNSLVFLLQATELLTVRVVNGSWGLIHLNQKWTSKIGQINCALKIHIFLFWSQMNAGCLRNRHIVLFKFGQDESQGL